MGNKIQVLGHVCNIAWDPLMARNKNSKVNRGWLAHGKHTHTHTHSHTHTQTKLEKRFGFILTTLRMY